jgi:hypothetical protein
MMLPDLVAGERQPISDARPSNRLTLVRLDAGPQDATKATEPRIWLWRAAKVTGRATLAILAGAACLLMLVGVVINLLGATP